MIIIEMITIHMSSQNYTLWSISFHNGYNGEISCKNVLKIVGK